MRIFISYGFQFTLIGSVLLVKRFNKEVYNAY
jgi:hypothetical protein